MICGNTITVSSTTHSSQGDKVYGEVTVVSGALGHPFEPTDNCWGYSVAQLAFNYTKL